MHDYERYQRLSRKTAVTQSLARRTRLTTHGCSQDAQGPTVKNTICTSYLARRLALVPVLPSAWKRHLIRGPCYVTRCCCCCCCWCCCCCFVGLNALRCYVAKNIWRALQPPASRQLCRMRLRVVVSGPCTHNPQTGRSKDWKKKKKKWNPNIDPKREGEREWVNEREG